MNGRNIRYFHWRSIPTFQIFHGKSLWAKLVYFIVNSATKNLIMMAHWRNIREFHMIFQTSFVWDFSMVWLCYARAVTMSKRCNLVMIWLCYAQAMFLPKQYTLIIWYCVKNEILVLNLFWYTLYNIRLLYV